MGLMKNLHSKKVEAIFKEIGDSITKVEDKENFDYLYTYYTEYLPTKDKSINYDVYNKIVLNALNGDADYQAALGEVFMYARGVKQDADEALRWIISSASFDSAYGETMLGLCYYNGFGLYQNTQRAINWFTKAANKNYADAKHYLGCIFLFSSAAEAKYLNPELGFHLMVDAFDEGVEDAFMKVIICLLKGLGTPVSLFKAFRIVQIGEERGVKDASRIHQDAFYDFDTMSEEEINNIDVNLFLSERAKFFYSK